MKRRSNHRAARRKLAPGQYFKLAANPCLFCRVLAPAVARRLPAEAHPLEIQSRTSETTGMTVSADAPLRRTLYTFLCLAAASLAAARILSSKPIQGDNDGSRWATIRALGDNGSYVIGVRKPGTKPGEYIDRGIVSEEG